MTGHDVMHGEQGKRRKQRVIQVQYNLTICLSFLHMDTESSTFSKMIAENLGKLFEPSLFMCPNLVICHGRAPVATMLAVRG